MFWSLREDEADIEAVKQLYNDSDRSVGIVGAAIVEASLQSLLERQLRNDKVLRKAIFKPSGPIGTFSTKIDMGYLLTLYGPEARRDLVTMKDIRNIFAHHININSFKDKKIAALSMNLGLVDRHVKDKADKSESTLACRIKYTKHIKERDGVLGDPRNRYIMTAIVLTTLLRLALIETRRYTPLF